MGIDIAGTMGKPATAHRTAKVCIRIAVFIAILACLKLSVAAMIAVLRMPTVSSILLNVPFIVLGFATTAILVGVFSLSRWARLPAMILLGVLSMLNLTGAMMVLLRPDLVPPLSRIPWRFAVAHLSTVGWLLCLAVLSTKSARHLFAGKRCVARQRPSLLCLDSPQSTLFFLLLLKALQLNSSLVQVDHFLGPLEATWRCRFTLAARPPMMFNARSSA